MALCWREGSSQPGDVRIGATNDKGGGGKGRPRAKQLYSFLQGPGPVTSVLADKRLTAASMEWQCPRGLRAPCPGLARGLSALPAENREGTRGCANRVPTRASQRALKGRRSTHTEPPFQRPDACHVLGLAWEGAAL